MANYTITLGELVSSGYSVWDDSWPIFDEQYRAQLKSKIEKHYWFREIGFETADMFKFYLNASMNEIMPYYNQRYKANLLSVGENPLRSGSRESSTNHTIVNANDTTDSGTSTNHVGVTGSVTNTGSSSGSTMGKNYDIPASGSGAGGFDDSYVSSGTQGTSSSTSTNTDESSDTTEQTGTNNNHKVGSSNTSDIGSSSENYTDEPLFELLARYRDSFVNIDMEVITDKSIETCFMGVF